MDHLAEAKEHAQRMKYETDSNFEAQSGILHALIAIAERVGQLVEQGQVVTTLEELPEIKHQHDDCPACAQGDTTVGVHHICNEFFPF